MSVDFTLDYSNHTLLDSKPKYSNIYKLVEVDASAVKKGDLLLLKTPCGQYRLYMAIADSDDDNTLHLSKYSEIDFAKADPSGNISDSVISGVTGDSCGYNTTISSDPCGC